MVFLWLKLMPRWAMRAAGAAAGAVVLAVLALWGAAGFYAARTIDRLLGENRRLQEALANLTHEDLIGLARVVEQVQRDGRRWTRLRFVEVDRAQPSRILLEREYTIEGDVVYFEAFIVRFDGQLVADGRARALYLWRRVYGERQPPAEGFPIEYPGLESPRYRALSQALGLADQTRFWTEIWSLADRPDRLERLGVRAVHGTAVYRRLAPGFIYQFKLAATGDLIVESVPAI